MTSHSAPRQESFPPLEKAHSYRGELVFVDHANRRGSIRVEGAGTYFRRNAPHPFAMLPYGIIRYHGAPADLRDIQLGTVLHVRGVSSARPEDSPPCQCWQLIATRRKTRMAIAAKESSPAENHVLLLEDEPSYCQREGLVWKLKEVDLKK